VLVIECKNANKDEAIALGVDQIRRYHRETPELFVSQQLFTATDAIGFSYGVSWNTVRRNLFNWKHEEVGKLEAKVKSFCAIPQVLAFLKDYIVFAEKDEELNKYILRQHQTGAVEATVSRALDSNRTRGLVWHGKLPSRTGQPISRANARPKARGGVAEAGFRPRRPPQNPPSQSKAHDQTLHSISGAIASGIRHPALDREAKGSRRPRPNPRQNHLCRNGPSSWPHSRGDRAMAR
jgi:hypothetical protein